MSIFSKFIIPKLNIEFFFFLLSFFWGNSPIIETDMRRMEFFFPFFLPPNTIFIRYSILFNWNSILFFSLPFSILIWIQNSMPLLYAKWYLFHSSLIRFLFYKKKMFIHVVFMCVSVWKKTNDKFIRFTLQQRQQQQQQTRNSSEKKKTNIFIQFEFFCCHHHQRIFFLLEKDTWSNW